MSRPTVGGISRETQAYSTGCDRPIKRSIRSQYTTRPRKLHGGIPCTRRVTVCGRSGNMRFRTPSRSGRFTKSRTWCVFRVFGRVCTLTCSRVSQWLAPHDVRTGFYRFLKPGQPPNDKIHIMGRITATAPMCKRGLRSGPSEFRTDVTGDDSCLREELRDYRIGDWYLHCPAREIWQVMFIITHRKSL